MQVSTITAAQRYTNDNLSMHTHTHTHNGEVHYKAIHTKVVLSCGKKNTSAVLGCSPLVSNVKLTTELLAFLGGGESQGGKGLYYCWSPGRVCLAALSAIMISAECIAGDGGGRAGAPGLWHGRRKQGVLTREGELERTQGKLPQDQTQAGCLGPAVLQQLLVVPIVGGCCITLSSLHTVTRLTLTFPGEIRKGIFL